LRWISFEAKPVNSDVQLLWKTASEENTDYFIVQRSDNGANYQDVGLVNAIGTGGNQYLFTDIAAMKKAGVKKWYYRIKCIDIDTKASISRVVTVKVDKNVTQVQVLPNPVMNELKLVINATGNGSAGVRVMDMEGKLVLQRQVNLNRGENVITTDATHLPNGVYLLQVTNDGSSATGRARSLGRAARSRIVSRPPARLLPVRPASTRPRRVRQSRPRRPGRKRARGRPSARRPRVGSQPRDAMEPSV
jgi:hypothetical protein